MAETSVPELPVDNPAKEPKADRGRAGPPAPGVVPANNAMPARLAKALAECVAALPRVEYTKPEKGGGISYEYLSEEEIVLALKPILPAFGLTVVPVDMEILNRELYQSQRGGRMVNYVIRCRYRLMHVSGEWVPLCALGEGSDSGDKAINKAMTGAYKYALREAFLIAGGMDPDRTPAADIARAAKPAPPAAGGGYRQGGQAPAKNEKPAPAKNEKPLEERAKDAVAYFRTKAKTHADVNSGLRTARAVGFSAEQTKAITDAAYAKGASLFVAEIKAAKTIEESISVLDRALKAKLGPTHEAAIRAAASEREEQLIEADRAANPDADAGGEEEPTGVEF